MIWYDCGMDTTKKRSYHDSCGLAQALDLVGERWALLVVRELVFGPKRFTDLRTGLPGISPNVLSQRLDELETLGIVRKLRLPPPVSASVYDLTDWGRELDESMMVLGRWAARSPSFDMTGTLSADSVMMSLRTMFQPAMAHDLTVQIDLHLGDDIFHVDVRDGLLKAERGGADSPDATVETDPKTLAQVVYERRDLDDAGVKVSGDPDAFERFRSAFVLPEPATIPA
jgi:DNA-binding HxlR family transcriptional regulator